MDENDESSALNQNVFMYYIVEKMANTIYGEMLQMIWLTVRLSWLECLQRNSESTERRAATILFLSDQKASKVYIEKLQPQILA